MIPILKKKKLATNPVTSKKYFGKTTLKFFIRF